MTCSIKKDGRIIIRSSTSIFESLYHEIKDTVDQEKLKTNKEFDLFIEELDNSVFTMGGVRIDIKEIFTQSSNLTLLIALLERAIYTLKNQVRDYVIVDLWKFHAELIKYKEELEAQEK